MKKVAVVLGVLAALSGAGLAAGGGATLLIFGARTYASNPCPSGRACIYPNADGKPHAVASDGTELGAWSSGGGGGGSFSGGTVTTFVTYGGSSSATPSVTWTNATLSNLWVANGGGGDVPGYMKDAVGVVHLRGWLSGGSPGTAAFTLPAGYRPSATVQFPTTTDSAHMGLIQITSSGVVSVYDAAGGSSASTLTTIDSIQFVAGN